MPFFYPHGTIKICEETRIMGRQSGQISMVILDMAELIFIISFDIIYDPVAPNYPANGRPSVDPVSTFKILLAGYLRVWMSRGR